MKLFDLKMTKQDSKKQKDLFGLDPKEEEELLSYESLKDKLYRKTEEKNKLDLFRRMTKKPEAGNQKF
tara:strand:+ start:326 stop:529 length:204 start_codon:yes stop_codon:yes gene_type:complete